MKQVIFLFLLSAMSCIFYAMEEENRPTKKIKTSEYVPMLPPFTPTPPAAPPEYIADFLNPVAPEPSPEDILDGSTINLVKFDYDKLKKYLVPTFYFRNDKPINPSSLYKNILSEIWTAGNIVEGGEETYYSSNSENPKKYYRREIIVHEDGKNIKIVETGISDYDVDGNEHIWFESRKGPLGVTINKLPLSTISNSDAYGHFDVTAINLVNTINKLKESFDEE